MGLRRKPNLKLIDINRKVSTKELVLERNRTRTEVKNIMEVKKKASKMKIVPTRRACMRKKKL